MTNAHIRTGFIATAENTSDSSALIAGAVIAHIRGDHGGLELYRVCTAEELVTSACLAAAEMALAATKHIDQVAANRLYAAVHRDSGEVGSEEHLLAMRMLRATARAVDARGVIAIEMEDFNEVDHLQASIEAFRRASASCGIFPLAAALTIRRQAPWAQTA